MKLKSFTELPHIFSEFYRLKLENFLVLLCQLLNYKYRTSLSIIYLQIAAKKRKEQANKKNRLMC